MMRDLGLDEIPLKLHTDSAAAIGIASRTGLGKLRHLQVHLLWVQQHVRNKVFELLKVPGKENPADLCTKHLGQAEIGDHLHRMRAVKFEGRADSAPATLSASLITPQPREHVGSTRDRIGANSGEHSAAGRRTELSFQTGSQHPQSTLPDVMGAGADHPGYAAGRPAHVSG